MPSDQGILRLGMSGTTILAIFRELTEANVPCGDEEDGGKLGDKCYFRVLRLYAAQD